MQISRRDALMGATAAAVVTGTITAPLGIKAALGGDPVLPAYEAFEAARLEYLAICDQAHAVGEAVKADLPPEPHQNRTDRDLSWAESEEASEWRGLRNRHVTARLGMNEDDFCNAYLDRVDLAYTALTGIQATTVAGLLCQVRAWWSTYEDMSVAEVPRPEEGDNEPRAVVQRVYHDLERLAGEVPS